MIKYLAKDYGRPKILKVEIEKETEKSVWDKRGFREAKKTKDSRYCDSFDEAKQWLIDRYELELGSARRRLQIAQGNYGNAKGLKES